MTEQSFLNERDVYVSNSRVVIYGTTYATANITSVRKSFTNPSNGCAILLIIFGGLAALGSLGNMFGGKTDAAGALVMSLILLVAGVLWFRSLRPTYHVMLATAAGERQGLTSQDEGLVNRVTAAIAEAIIFRG